MLNVSLLQVKWLHVPIIRLYPLAYFMAAWMELHVRLNTNIFIYISFMGKRFAFGSAHHFHSFLSLKYANVNAYYYSKLKVHTVFIRTDILHVLFSSQKKLKDLLSFTHTFPGMLIWNKDIIEMIELNLKAKHVFTYHPRL